MQHKWTILCERIIVDETSQLLSLIDVIEDINIPALPCDDKNITVVPIRWVLVNFWARTDETIPEYAEIKIRLVSPIETVVAERELKIDLTEKVNLRHFFRSGELPVQGEGTYRFIIEINNDGVWEIVSETPYRVNVMPVTETQPSPSNNV